MTNLSKLLIFLFSFFIEGESIYNAVLISGARPSAFRIYTCICFFRFLPCIVYYVILNTVPVLCSRFSLVVYFMHSSVYLLILRDKPGVWGNWHFCSLMTGGGVCFCLPLCPRGQYLLLSLVRCPGMMGRGKGSRN